MTIRELNLARRTLHAALLILLAMPLLSLISIIAGSAVTMKIQYRSL